MKLLLILFFSLFFLTSQANNIQGAINSDTTWSGNVTVVSDVTISAGKTLTIDPSTVILVKKGANILVSRGSTINVNGTSGNEVRFRSEFSGNSWGAIKARGSASKIVIHYADIQNGQVAAYDTAEVYVYDSYLHDYIQGARPIIYTYRADTAYVTSCHISNYYETNFVFTSTLVENCLFEYMIGDGIDFDNSPAGTTIRLSTLRHGNGFNIDAIDWGVRDYEAAGSNGTVDRCLIYDISDKGISIGEKCQDVTVTGTLIYNADAGVSVKDSSIAQIYNNTFYSCRMGIESRQERDGMGGGHYTSYDNIIWNCTEPLVLEDGGTGQIDYCILNTTNVYPGIGNLNSNPLFSDENNNDFLLLIGSPAIGSGSVSNNRGAIFPNGSSLTISANYLALGSPSRNSTFVADSIHPISWTTGSSVSLVNLYLSSDNGQNWNLLQDSVNASEQKFQWQVPNIYSSLCLVKVTSTTDPLLSDSSYSSFTITPKFDSLNVVADVIFSDSGGFYNDSFNLNLSAQTGAVIYYTLDGSEPTDQSLVYTQPILVKPDTIHTGYPEQNIISTTEPQFPYSYIRTSPTSQVGPVPGYWVPPQIDLFKATVVKAKAFVSGKGLSKTTTESYFVENSINNRFTMPVLSLSSNKENLFDYYDGVYIPGVDFEGATFTGNYERSGRDFEKNGHIEMFEPDGKPAFSLNVGYRVKGEFIRSACYKSLEVYARSEYDEQSNIEYDVFQGMKRQNSIIPLKRFKRLIFRNAGNQTVWGNINPMFRDGFAQNTIAHLNIKTQGFRPAILFINGEYWGVHNIMEDNDTRSIENHYGLRNDSIVIMEHNLEGTNQLVEGTDADLADYENLISYITNNDMSLNANYDYLLTKIDSNSFCDHWVATIFTGKSNFDHNVSFWKYKGTTVNTCGGDGKWRWMVNDFDGAFMDVNYDHQWAVEFVGPDYIFSRAILNQRFKNMFINRMADQLNSAFKTNYLLAQFNEMKAKFSPEMDEHIGRWSTPFSIADWDYAVSIGSTFIIQRPAYQKQFIMNRYGIDTMHYQLNVSDPLQGYITINSLDITNNTKGLADSTMPYPWTGTYFKTIPTTLKANPLPGFKFVKWLETNDTNNPIHVTPTSDLTYTAVFATDPSFVPERKLYINELMAENNITLSDNKGQKEDWIEIYNDKNETIDLAGYIFTDGYKTYRIPDGNDSTKITPKGFKLFWADDDEKQGVMHLNFKLSKEKDEVMLFSPDRNTLIDSVSFADQLGDISFGRKTDGSPAWIYFPNGTPGATNSSKTDNGYENEFTVYPVPASNSLTISIRDVDAQPLTIEYIDLLGRKVISYQFDYKPGDIITNDISVLNTGFYTMTIQGSSFKKNTSFIKQ
ncbi:MAG: CotH kinase family protein [Bacteroidota bacterium]|nr:CotH kinase family protein [Bacteroidota bacterium]